MNIQRNHDRYHIITAAASLASITVIATDRINKTAGRMRDFDDNKKEEST